MARQTTVITDDEADADVRYLADEWEAETPGARWSLSAVWRECVKRVARQRRSIQPEADRGKRSNPR